MRKLFLIAVLILGIASFAYAENSATGQSGLNFREQQVFITAYNGSGTDITSNAVVVLDTTAANIASGSTLGAYIRTTTTSADARVIGVTDEVITNGRSGRICVRGPHKCQLTAAPVLGATVAASATAGFGTGFVAGGVFTNDDFGVALSAGVIGGGGTPVVADGFTPGDGTSNYWIWVGGPGR